MQHRSALGDAPGCAGRVAAGVAEPHEVQRGDIVRLLDRIAKTAPYSANRTFEALRRMFRWGVEKDLIQASPVVGIRPPTKETQRQRSHTDDELRAIIGALGGEGKMGDAIQLCLYTGVRIRQARHVQRIITESAEQKIVPMAQGQ